MTKQLQSAAKVAHIVWTFVCFIAAAAFAYGAITVRLDDVEKKADSVEDVKKDVAVIKNDVSWIKDRLK